MILWLMGMGWAEEYGCATFSHWREKTTPVPLEVTIADGEKINRDAYNNNFNQLESENFVLKWGDNFLLNGLDSVIIEFFETTWTAQVHDWELTQPDGTEQALFNVYIGNSGNGAPEIPDTAGGYFTYDDQGWPMIVLNPSSFDVEGYIPTLISHEFFHAVQRASNLYTTEESRWFFESSAEWSAANMYPSSPYSVSAINSYMTLSDQSLNTFLHLYEAETEEEQELASYAYGSVLFLIFLHEYTMDGTLIPSIWKQNTLNNNPLDTIKTILEEREMNFYDVWMKHNESVVFMEEYSYGSMYLGLTEPDWWSDSWTGNGTAMTDSTSNISLENLGFRVHRLYDMTKPRYRFQVWANPIGTFDSIAEFRATIVQRTGSRVTKFPIEMNNWFGELTIDNVSEYDDIYLIVGAWADKEHSSFIDDEQFFYDFAMEGLDAPYQQESTEGEDIEGGLLLPDMQVCGCSAIEPTSTLGMLAILGLFSRRRQHDAR